MHESKIKKSKRTQSVNPPSNKNWASADRAEELPHSEISSRVQKKLEPINELINEISHVHKTGTNI